MLLEVGSVQALIGPIHGLLGRVRGHAVITLQMLLLDPLAPSCLVLKHNKFQISLRISVYGQISKELITEGGRNEKRTLTRSKSISLKRRARRAFLIFFQHLQGTVA